MEYEGDLYAKINNRYCKISTSKEFDSMKEQIDDLKDELKKEKDFTKKIQREVETLDFKFYKECIENAENYKKYLIEKFQEVSKELYERSSKNGR